MEVETEARDGLTVVKISGDVNGMTCGRLEEELVRLIDGGSRRIVLDLMGVRYISSAGLRVLMIAAKRLTGDGAFALSRAGGGVRKVLDITGFSTIIPIHDDLEDAAAAVRAA
jgi:anti-anti-sigma factor